MYCFLGSAALGDQYNSLHQPPLCSWYHRFGIWFTHKTYQSKELEQAKVGAQDCTLYEKMVLSILWYLTLLRKNITNKASPPECMLPFAVGQSCGNGINQSTIFISCFSTKFNKTVYKKIKLKCVPFAWGKALLLWWVYLHLHPSFVHANLKIWIKAREREYDTGG